MTDHSGEFFQQLATSPPRVLRSVTATLRIDLAGRAGTVEHWYIDIKKGKVGVSHRKTRADAVVSADRALFDKLVTGRANAMASTLRGLVRIDGDPSLIVALQRLLPGPKPVSASHSTKDGA